MTGPGRHARSARTGDHAPSAHVTIALAFVVVAALACFTALYVFTPAAERPELVGLVARGWPALLAAAPGVGAWLLVGKVNNKTDQQSATLADNTETLTHVAGAVNGDLQRFILGAVTRAIAGAGAPPVRATDLGAPAAVPAVTDAAVDRAVTEHPSPAGVAAADALDSSSAESVL